MDDQKKHLTRREVLIASAGLAAAGTVGTLAMRSHSTLAEQAGATASSSSSGSLPVKEIEAIMETPGMVSNGVLTIDQDRADLHVIGPHGLPWKPAFELINEFFFQSLGNGRAILNGDVTVLAEETNPFIDKLFQGGLVFQAFHQHFFDEDPQTWHIHFRGIGDPIQLAKAIIAAVKVTGTPLPQMPPAHPTTPLPAQELGRILGGMATISSDGVVSVSIPRADTITLGGVKVSPDLGVDVTVAFEPLGNNGQAICAPDYALIASEVNPALAVSRAEGFVVHCLYNQETDEFPQLYFSHNLKVGNAIELAHQVSKVLDKMNVKRS